MFPFLAVKLFICGQDPPSSCFEDVHSAGTQHKLHLIEVAPYLVACLLNNFHFKFLFDALIIVMLTFQLR